MKSLFKENPAAFDFIDRFQMDISERLQCEYPRLHYCGDWDYMLIDEGTKEFECCLCYKP